MTFFSLLTLFFLMLLSLGLFLYRKERVSREVLERRLKELHEELERVFDRLEEERARLETTFSGMAEGVLLTDSRGDILHLNPAFREMFNLPGPVEGRSALEVLASVACDDAIRSVIETGERVKREIQFEKPKRRVFQVHFSPMRRDGKLLGVVSVFHDLTEIRRLEEVRRDFVANLSHELKTPLTAIRGFSETLLEGNEDPEASRKQLEIIFRHATELTHLVENLLNLSRIESGKEEIRTEPIPLKSFVEALLERFQTQARVRRIELIDEIGAARRAAPPNEEADPVIQADPSKLNQILSNLLDNAIKYAPEGGKIWIRYRVESDPDETAKGGSPSVIEVEDTGPGIPAADQERIFERFYRVDKARSRDSGGAGLGLAIVKHLVELHGGSIEVESEMGHGSRFQIYLPNT